jgi:NCS2 family nucleobase:cation symporter-2
MNHLLFQVEDRPPLFMTVLLAAQHMLAALGGIIAVPLVVGAATNTKMRGKTLARGILCDGVGSAFAALMSSPPVSTFAQNVGVVSLTGVASRHVVALTGVMLFLAGLFPILGAVVVTIPQPVLGGAGLMMFAMIISAGVQLLSHVEHTKRNGIIMAVAIGCGLAVTVRPELLSKLPAFVKEVFGSGITVGALVAVALNLVLPERPVEKTDDEDEDVPQAFLTSEREAA